MSTDASQREARFRALFTDAYQDVLRFAQRRVHPSHAEDVVAEAFVVAWRRLDDAPRRPDDLRAWLFGITRNHLLNARRGQGRRDALAVRIAETATHSWSQHPSVDLVPHRLDLAAAWRRLSPADQEVLAARLPAEVDARQTRAEAAPRRCRHRDSLHPIDPGECFMRPKAFFDLRSYDVADTALTPDQQQRADAMLERIVTTPTVAPGDLERRAKPRIRPMKLVGILVAAALLAIGMIAFPGSGRSSNAYASWTPTPSPVAAGDLDVVAHACRDKVGDHSGPNGGVSFDSATIPVALAERRGDLVAVLFHQNNPDMAVACVATNRPGSTDVDDVNVGAGGSSGPAWTPAPDRITQGTIAQFRNQPAASVTQGAVGTNVATVTIHSAGQTFTATVRDGRYAAWWPGKAFTDAPRQPSGQGGPQVNLTYDVTLTDGTTLTNVTPATP